MPGNGGPIHRPEDLIKEIRSIHPAFEELFSMPIDDDQSLRISLLEWCRKWLREDQKKGKLVDEEINHDFDRSN